MYGKMSAKLKNSLEKIGLGTLYQGFVNEHIDDASFPRLLDSELSQFAVETFGYRIKLREEMRRLELVTDSFVGLKVPERSEQQPMTVISPMGLTEIQIYV